MLEQSFCLILDGKGKLLFFNLMDVQFEEKVIWLSNGVLYLIKTWTVGKEIKSKFERFQSGTQISFDLDN